ncbi:MAG: polysaccharide deacetylase family protein [Clostridia bacterium]|nr:polysaccharide deacetylase family protein [Clostridia bacterium]
MRIALTFDDGPNTETTPQVLDILQEHGIAASFFLIADSITPESAKVARRAFDMGCDIENHSRTHSFMNRMTPEEIREEIRYCSERITEITGRPPAFFRPPYIAVNRTLFDNVDLTFICGAGCEDWVPEVPADARAARVLAHAEDGQIVLLHDMPGNVNTVEALKTIIPELKKRGFSFVTVRQLFAEAGVKPVPGRMYTNVWQTTDEPHNPA